MTNPLERLRHHVSGAIERGEKEPIVEQCAKCARPELAMVNGLGVYEDAGRKLARATNEQDGGRMQFERDWFARAVRLEQTDEARAAARAAFDQGYEAVRRI